MEEALAMLGDGIHSLVIIPDEQLSRLPFEVLLTEDSGADYFDKLPYLIKKYHISYALSSRLVTTNNQKKRAQKKLLGIGFSGDSETKTKAVFGELPGTEDEIRQLKAKIEGDYFLGEEANKERFLAVANDFEVLHLAIHGKSDASNRYQSSLIFNGPDQVLHTSDLYTLDLSARLAILSACESGRGELNKGEGVFSIARGFAIVGVPSIVMSLWQVSDELSNQVIKGFYDGMLEGHSVATAMRYAKLNYLQESDNLTSHPFFWSTFVVLGEDQSLALKAKGRTPTLWMIIIAVMVASFLTAWLWSKSKKATG